MAETIKLSRPKAAPVLLNARDQCMGRRAASPNTDWIPAWFWPSTAIKQRALDAALQTRRPSPFAPPQPYLPGVSFALAGRLSAGSIIESTSWMLAWLAAPALLDQRKVPEDWLQSQAKVSEQLGCSCSRIGLNPLEVTARLWLEKTQGRNAGPCQG